LKTKRHTKKEIAQAYSERIYLDKAEKTILNYITNKSGEFRMLDIGCGGGRTTHFFVLYAPIRWGKLLFQHGRSVQPTL
jgi:2-polyprenyl-3-methyl-5-hydroxy-6-metoxy-1,4-benzoquinol methylase